MAENDNSAGQSIPAPPNAEPQWPHFPENPPSASIFAKWLKLLIHPDVETYAEEGSDADLITAIMNALLYAAFLVIYVMVRLVLLAHVQLVDIFYLFFLALLATLASITGLFLGSGIIYLLAKTLGGGKGGFTGQTYLFSMYNTPIVIIAILLGLFGQVGTILGYVVGAYELFLSYIMLRAIHQTNPLRALVVVITYALISILLAIFVLLPLTRGVLQL
jgi:hypothetical protein